METNSLSVKEIRCKYQHNKFYDGYLVDHFCQIFSPYFTWLFVRLGWTPNYVTSLMIIFGILGATFFVIPSLSFKIVGVLFIYLWYIMDISDGEVARATKTFSKFGQEFDYTAHVINHPLFVLSFTLCIIQANILYGLLIVGLGLVDMIFRNLVAFNSIKTLLIHSFLSEYNNFNTSICENNFLFGDISNSLGILGNAGNDQ